MTSEVSCVEGCDSKKLNKILAWSQAGTPEGPDNRYLFLQRQVMHSSLWLLNLALLTRKSGCSN